MFVFYIKANEFFVDNDEKLQHIFVINEPSKIWYISFENGFS